MRTWPHLEISPLSAKALENTQTERMLLAAQVAQLTAERDRLRAELKHMDELIAAARVKSALVDDLQVEVATLRHELNLEKLARAAIEESRSWRLILRVRRLLDKVRRRQ